MPDLKISRRTAMKAMGATAASLAMPPVLRAADQVKIGFLAPLTGSEAILGAPAEVGSPPPVHIQFRDLFASLRENVNVNKGPRADCRFVA